MMKNYLCLLLFTVLSCQSNDRAEYEILNIAIDRSVFPPTDMDMISRISKEHKVDMKEALSIYDTLVKHEQYTYSISDTLYPVDLPKSVWEQLRYNDIFKIQGVSDQSIPIDFKKINVLENRKRIQRTVGLAKYLGHFKFHRVLFDKFGSYAYLQTDIPEGPGRLHGSFGLQFRKENGKWKLIN